MFSGGLMTVFDAWKVSIVVICFCWIAFSACSSQVQKHQIHGLFYGFVVFL